MTTFWHKIFAPWLVGVGIAVVVATLAIWAHNSFNRFFQVVAAILAIAAFCVLAWLLGSALLEWWRLSL